MLLGVGGLKHVERAVLGGGRIWNELMRSDWGYKLAGLKFAIKKKPN